MNNKQTPNTMIDFHNEMLRTFEKRVKFQQHCTDLAIKDFGRYSKQHIEQDDELNRLKELIQERKTFIEKVCVTK